MEWKFTFYNEALQNEILNLPVGIQARYIHLTQRMLKYGPDLGMPHTCAMGEGLFELRLKSKEGIARLFYCTLSDYNIMILNVFIKKSQKTPLKELKTARLRMREVKKHDDTR